MTGQADAGVPAGAIALVASAIRYALGACAQVASGEMTLPTPCAEWDLAALLAHLAASMADVESAIRTGYLDLDQGDPSAPGLREGPLPGHPVEVLQDRAANLLVACYDHHGPERLVLVGGLPLAADTSQPCTAISTAPVQAMIPAARGRPPTRTRRSGPWWS